MARGVKARANWLDRAIGAVAPRAGVRRAVARGTFDAVTARKYEGGAVGRRTDGWYTANSSADTEVSSAGPRLRDRMRDLVRNNAHAANAISVWATNVVGPGITPRANSADAALNKKVNDLFEAWAKKCDVEGQLDFYGMQTLACREMVEGGEAIIRKVLRSRSDGLPVPLQLQLLEGDLIDSARTGPMGNGNHAVQGVEYDKNNRRTAYWLFSAHPGSNFLDPRSTLQSQPVPASDIAHLYEKQRTQSRGVPWGSPIITTLRDLDDYVEAELVRKKTEACVVGIVTDGEEGGGEGIASSVVDAQGVPVEQFAPGLIAYARGGKDIKFNQPAPTGSHEAFERVTVRTIAVGYRVPYELLSHNLSDVSFISGRLGLQGFRRLVKAVQGQIFIPMFLQPVWEWFCETAFLAGLISTPTIAVQWSLPEFESIDPAKDALADLLEMRAGTMTLFEAIAKKGKNPHQHLAEIVTINKLLDKDGLVFDSDPRKVAKTGALQVASAAAGSDADAKD